MLPEPISVDHDVTDSPAHHHQQQQQHEQQVLESRDEPDCPGPAVTSPDVTRQPVTSSRLSTVKASDISKFQFPSHVCSENNLQFHFNYN